MQDPRKKITNTFPFERHFIITLYHNQLCFSVINSLGTLSIHVNVYIIS